MHPSCLTLSANLYGKPDYQASATVISEYQQVMGIMDGTWSDRGALEDLRHCGNTSSTTEVVQLRWEIVYNQIDNLLQVIPIIILSRELLKSKPFTVNVADVLQRECVESCLDIPIAEKLNPVGISILKVSEHLI